MEKSRTSVFEYYTFQLLPTHITQLDLFNIGITNISELRAKKNELFLSILLNENFHFYYKGHRLQHKVFYVENEVILLKIANIKVIRAEKDFKEVVYENEPSILIAIDNNRNSQTIAIQRNLDVFSKPDSVIDFFSKSLALPLFDYSLQIEINNTYEPQDFWELTEKYKNQIVELRIELVRENMSDIYSSISEELIEFGEYNNAHKQVLIQEAPKGDVLQHINKENKILSDFVEASAKGTGPISIRRIGSRRIISTKTNTKTKEVDITEINNLDRDTLLQVIREIFKIE